MSPSHSPGFLINDPAYVPFGIELFRGITPARLAVLLVIVTSLAFHFTPGPLSRGDYAMAWEATRRAWKGCFVSAVPMFFLIVKVDIWTERWNPGRRAGAFALALLVGAVMFSLSRWGLRYLHNVIGDPRFYWQFTVGYFWRALTIGGLLAAVLYFVTREREMAARLHRARLAKAEIERQIVEARLQVLHAQIEPHFLFNSLASVKRLYERHPAKARELLRNLKEYLQVATKNRATDATLGDEMTLARSFLGVFQLRMGERLHVRVDVAPNLESASIPALMIGTLLENAIKHGIAPRGLGGTLEISARREGPFLEVRVSDDGVGFRMHHGPGIGIANTRARLATLFGADASLEVVANPGGGVSALLRVPYRDTSPERALAA